jgi:hypothetical protein
MKLEFAAPAIFALALTGWLTASPVHAQAKATSALSNSVLKNAEYRTELIEGGRVRLSEGRFEGPALIDPRVIVRMMLIGAPARGDLDGDGIPDAAVMLVTSTGGEGVYYEVAAVLNRGGNPVHIATAPVGDRIQFQWLGIRKGEIEVTFIGHGEKDPPCCPKKKMTRRYRLEGTWLKEVTD